MGVARLLQDVRRIGFESTLDVLRRNVTMYGWRATLRKMARRAVSIDSLYRHHSKTLERPGIASVTAAGELFGPDRPDPADWGEGNPVIHADQRPELDVLLAHGAADDLVPVFFTEEFAVALRNGAHDVVEHYPDGVDHHVIYSADTAAPLIVDWLALDLGT